MDKERKEALEEILQELAQNLDITESEDEDIRKSYEAVGTWLSDGSSPLKDYDVEIRPQGSYNLGTTIRPITKDGDIDIDLVCELKGKQPHWTQKDVKNAVGDRIKAHGTYQQMLDKEGRRCWTILYRSNQNHGRYHMDILPSVTNKEYGEQVRRMFSENINENYDWNKVAIRITDKRSEDYNQSTDCSSWLKSNPFGYARWFVSRAQYKQTRSFSAIKESVQPLPRKSSEKLPLQRVVQLLKRHRDIIYKDDNDKPISVIITTLAAMAYNGETDLCTAVSNVANQIENYIEEKYSAEYGRTIKWIANPVNSEENFADNWPEEPRKERIFFEWIGKLKADILGYEKMDRIQLQEALKKDFGEEETLKTFSNIAKRTLNERKSGKLKMAATGMLSTLGNIGVKAGHNFYGVDEDEEE